VQGSVAKRTLTSRSNFLALTWRPSSITLRVNPRWPLERYTGFVAEINANITVGICMKRISRTAAGQADLGPV